MGIIVIELRPTEIGVDVLSRFVCVLPGDESAEEHGVHALDVLTVGPEMLSDL